MSISATAALTRLSISATGAVPRMKVRLTKKFAEELDGIDLSGVGVGDLLQLPRRDAFLLVREGWATPFIEPVDHADDRPRRRRTDGPEPAA